MSKDNKDNKKEKKSVGSSFLKGLKVFSIILLVIIVLGVSALGGITLSVLKDLPPIDPTNIGSSLNQTSFILTEDGELIEKIQVPEFRTVVDLNEIPKHLQDAFIAIEDERFEKHIGIDPKGIVSSAMDNLKAGRIVRGASTITQQLVKNVYLTNEKSWDRKIKEAYLAIKVQNILTKDQVLELYLNRIFLGQNAYGVQEAAQTYFSKDVGDLTIAESALLAGVAKSTAQFSPYQTIKVEDFNSDKHEEIAQLEILGEKYIAIYNPKSVERQHLVLNQMLSLGKINQSEYNNALNENIKENLKPAEKKIDGISSYFADYVKTQVLNSLQHQLGYTHDEAQNELLYGGLKIYSTIDLDLQRKLDDTYNNFTEILVGKTANIRGPALIDWRLSKSQNILDDKNNIIFYTKNNLFTENFELIIESGSYELSNGDLYISNNKLNPYPKHIDIADYYTIDDNKNLTTYTVGSIVIPEENYSLDENKRVKIEASYLNNNEDFYRIDEAGNLLINDKYFFRSTNGIVQPQSATVVSDYRSGQIKALVGGRDVEGTRVLNRATASQRQPGSAMKPIAAYLPALDNGYTAASAIDDIPFYNNKGELWPNNWHRGYKGIQTLRRSVEQSSNVNSVKTVEDIGISTSMKYLEKLGIIRNSDPNGDNFVTSAENKANNDENLSALGLGGMTKGLSPLEMTAAYGAIANGGVYIEPIAFTKVEDKNGNILIDNTPKENTVVSPQIAYIMADILRTTVTDGIAGRAKLSNMAVGGKTGTTQNQADIWFVGFSPYYVTGVWIGNDSPQITLSEGSGTAVQLWNHIMTQMHEGLEARTSFDKPDGIVTVNVCNQSGMLPTQLCSRDPRGSTVRSEIFAKGTEPKQSCSVHIEGIIDSSTGKIANEYCPISSLQSRVFVQRTPPYIPSNNNGIVPSDYGYTSPSQVCNVHGPGSVRNDPDYDDLDEDDDENEDVESNEEKDDNSSDEKDKDKDKENNKDKDKKKDNDFPLDTEDKKKENKDED